MESKQHISTNNPESIIETGTRTVTDTNKAYMQFLPGITNLKELDLTGIEPLMPLTYRKRPGKV